jgi:hypothetical protein
MLKKNFAKNFLSKCFQLIRHERHFIANKKLHALSSAMQLRGTVYI